MTVSKLSIWKLSGLQAIYLESKTVLEGKEQLDN